MKFWLGLHQPNWLPRVEVPACVSYSTLRKRKTLPRPLGPIFLDSRGFSEVGQHGRYTFSADTYAAFVQRCRDEWGDRLAHASIMDWMCEPFMLERTRMTVAEHQRLTTASWVALNSINGSIPWVPVLQGWSLDDYHRHLDLYDRHTGTNLRSLPLVGLGSVCRRQGTDEAARIVKSLYARGLRNLHGFGFKVTGLVSKNLRLANYLASSDSMAWSFGARKEWDERGVKPCDRDDHKGSCANCLRWALQWRDRLELRVAAAPRNGTQRLLF